MKEPIYEGKSKALYILPSKDKLLMKFKDDITAFNNEKHDIIKNKGYLNNQICASIFEYLGSKGITTHYVRRASHTEMVVQKAEVIPIEVVIRNYITGGLAKRFGLEDKKGSIISFPNNTDPRMYSQILELFYKSDELGDPLMNRDHAIVFGYATSLQLSQMERCAQEVNYHLKQYFGKIGINLADFKLEFGINENGQLMLVDDICPDGCRLWDKYSNKHFDKDNYRYGFGDILGSYTEVYDRIRAVYDNGITIEDYLKKTGVKK